MILHLPMSTASGARRSGPLGRLARLGLLAIFAASLYSIVDGNGSARFRNPHILSEPSAWLLHVMMLIVFVVLAGTIASTLPSKLPGARLVRHTQIAAMIVLVISAVVAAMIGALAYGSVWGFPLADLVWWFDVLMLAVGTASTALAIVLGTLGCEIGALRELSVCLRGTPLPSADATPCIVGLHALDDWERRRSQPHSDAGR